MTRPHVVALLLAGLLLAGCSAPTPAPTPAPTTPTPTPTPTPLTCYPEFSEEPFTCTPAEHEAMLARDGLYEQAWAITDRVLLGFLEARRSKQQSLPPELVAVLDPAGTALEDLRLSMETSNRLKSTITGTATISGEHRFNPARVSGGIPGTLAVVVCFDQSEVSFQAPGRAAVQGTRGSQLLVFTETEGLRVHSIWEPGYDACA